MIWNLGAFLLVCLASSVALGCIPQDDVIHSAGHVKDYMKGIAGTVRVVTEDEEFRVMARKELKAWATTATGFARENQGWIYGAVVGFSVIGGV